MTANFNRRTALAGLGVLSAAMSDVARAATSAVSASSPATKKSSDLLDKVLRAHGGYDNWKAIKGLDAVGTPRYSSTRSVIRIRLEKLGLLSPCQSTALCEATRKTIGRATSCASTPISGRIATAYCVDARATAKAGRVETRLPASESITTRLAL